MLDIFTAPGRLFARLRERPVWLLPLALVTLANLAATAVSIRYVDWPAQREVILERIEQADMTEDQREEALARAEQFATNPLVRWGLPLAGGLITQLVAFFFLALIYNLSLPLCGSATVETSGAPGSYRRVLAVTAHAGLVALPAAFLRVALILLSRSASATTSLLAAFPGLESGFLQVVLGRLDPFAIWGLVLTGLGLKVVFDLKGRKSYLLVAAVWLVLTLAFALLAGLGR